MLFQILKRRVSRYRKDDGGTVAIEFSILALPFMVLIFGILELAIVFFTTTSLNHSLLSNTRTLRVGEQTAICGDIDQLKQNVCDTLNVSQCLNKLNLSVMRVGSNQFNTAVLTQFQASDFTVDEDNDTVDVPGGNVLDAGISGDEILIVKAIYQHDLILPGRLTRLANFGLSNKRVLSVTQAMRTEPFPDVTCP